MKKNFEICQLINNELKDLILKDNLVINTDFVKQAYNNAFNDVKGKVLIRKYTNGVYLIKFGETIFDNVETLLSTQYTNDTMFTGHQYSGNISYNLYDGFYKFDYIRNYELYKNHTETTEEVWKTYYDKYLKIKEVFEKELR